MAEQITDWLSDVDEETLSKPVILRWGRFATGSEAILNSLIHGFVHVGAIRGIRAVGGLSMSPDQRPCTIYLVRHAESEVNAQIGVPTQYSAGGSPLSQRGRQQAADLARRLQPFPISQVYASERSRAQETAQILAAGQPINTAPLLHERPDPAGAEAESDADAVVRITTVLHELARNHPGETVVAVSHGYIMRTLLVALGFATFDELPKDALIHTGTMQLTSDGEQLTLVGVVGAHKLEVNVLSADERTSTTWTSRYS